MIYDNRFQLKGTALMNNRFQTEVSDVMGVAVLIRTVLDYCDSFQE